ncbi:MAG: NAD-dependent epimerase/dehydratase family protein [Bdellovibrionota bacterium]
MEKLVLINGASGFLGTHCVREALAAGWKVRASDLGPKPSPDLAALGVEYVQADLTDLSQAKKITFGCTHVINVAGLFRFDATKEQLYRANVLATRHMCQAALEAGVERFVHVATIGVYGRLPRNKKVKESYRKSPKNDYELTKKQGEDVALSFWKRQGLPVVSLRPTVIYGPGSRYAVAWMIALFSMMRVLGTKEGYAVKGLSDMCHVHVADVARALAWLLDHGKLGEAYNCADETPLAWGDLLHFLMGEFGIGAKRIIPMPKAISQPLGSLLQLIPDKTLKDLNARIAKGWQVVERKYGVSPYLAPQLDREFLSYGQRDHLMDTSKLRETGFRLQYPDTREGLRQTIAWYREKGWIPGEKAAAPPSEKRAAGA